MDVYERSVTMSAPPDAVFAFLQEPANLPKYLPPIKAAEVDAPDHIQLDGSAPGGGEFHNEGSYHVDGGRRRMEWGAELDHAYSGWLEVAQDGDPDAAKVTVHLEFGPRSPHPEIQAQASEGRDPTEEALGLTLEAIKRQVEGRGGPVDTSELAPPDA